VSLGLAVALVAMSALAMAALLVPLWRGRRRVDPREAYNLAVYRDQLTEIERDIARGVLDGEQAAAARVEISRRILALAPSAAAAPPNSAPAVVIAAMAIVLLPVAAGTLYWQLGSPGIADLPFAERAASPAAGPREAAAAPVDIAAAVTKIEAHLKEHPDELQGWILLGRAQLSLEHYAAAVDAYRHAADLSGQRPDLVGDYGEAQVLAAGGVVTVPAQQAFEAARRDPESAPRSRYYLALARAQQGDTKTALQEWVDLAAESPKDAVWLPLLRQRIAEAAKVLGLDPATLKASAGAAPAPR
jgi:cytochrome c-type biogenesis protein CcmH